MLNIKNRWITGRQRSRISGPLGLNIKNQSTTGVKYQESVNHCVLNIKNQWTTGVNYQESVNRCVLNIKKQSASSFISLFSSLKKKNPILLFFHPEVILWPVVQIQTLTLRLVLFLILRLLFSSSSCCSSCCCYSAGRQSRHTKSSARS